MPLLALLLLVPVLAEITVFIVVGRWIGVLATLALFIAIGVIGSLLLKRQGMRALREMQAALARGEPPAEPVAHAAPLVLAALLLVFPGFPSDLMALPLLVPTVRRMVIRWLGVQAKRRGGFTVWPGGRSPAGGTVIDADYTEVKPEGGRDPSLPRIEDSRWGGPDQGDGRRPS
ncbi:FxsA family protein [Inquilinus sp. Marseille-Q2685]|uniref:FxsA family protein n=1 Tax=Inquilinus sp. Marseille-Q2685 TaxID=2866581 RepID=UPI001CE41CE4|nr:FxsA family protein [Inquilinus sp. Marseille-Q2685]